MTPEQKKTGDEEAESCAEPTRTPRAAETSPARSPPSAWSHRPA